MDINDVLNQIKELLDGKKYQEIEDIAWDLTEEHPTSVELFILLGKAALADENLSKANFYFIEAMLQGPDQTEPLFLLAELSILLGDNSRAEGYYHKILKLEANNVLALVGIADLAYVSNFYSDAAKQYEDALKAGAQKALSDEQYAVLVYKAASSLFVEEKLEEALALIAAFAPAGFSEMVSLAKLKIYVSMGKEGFQDAAACLEALHKALPTEPKYILQLLPYLDNDADASKIESLYSALFGLEISESQKESALRMRSELRMGTENWAGALEDLDALIATNKSWVYYQNRSVVKEALKDVKGALGDLTEAMKVLGEESADLFMLRAKLCLRANAHDLAIADFDKVLGLVSKGRMAAEAYYHRGLAYKKKKDNSNAVKSLMKAELLGSTKARTMLLKNFSEQMAKMRTKSKDKYEQEFKKEQARNLKSPILQQAFGKLWVPNMSKFFQTMEKEIETLPGQLIKGVLASASKDLFLITAEGLLFVEGEKEPLEAFYKVVVESEHSILLELQPTKGSAATSMRLAFFEGNLLLSYPVSEVEVTPKYFISSDKASADQKTRLTSKQIAVPYMESIENSIAEVVGA